MTKLMLL